MQLIKRLLTVVLIVSMMLSLISCGGGNNTPDNGNGTVDGTPDTDINEGNGDAPSEKINYTVTVLSPLGAPVPNVNVFVHEDGGADYNVCTAPKQTDGYGRAVFELESGKLYSVSLLGVPEAYSAKSGSSRSERYSLDTTDTAVVLDSNPGYAPTSYKRGDVMANFTLTDIDGNEYTLYDLLSERKAVVLNFWFTTCAPCANEFPALNTAYNSYKDQLEVLAINDLAHYKNNSAQDVREYADSKGLDMPFVSTYDTAPVSLSRFGGDGYPTTVVIDRYGYITFIHTGAVTSAASWNRLFEFYTADDYTTTILKSIEDLK